MTTKKPLTFEQFKRSKKVYTIPELRENKLIPIEMLSADDTVQVLVYDKNCYIERNIQCIKE